MSKLSKEKPFSPEEPRSGSAPGVLFPVAVGVPSEDFKLTDAQYENLEKTGGIKLSEELRASLLTLAIFWIDDLRLRRTARPKQFRECLERMDNAFLRAEEACRWEHGLEYHLVHWAMEALDKDAEGFPVTLAALENQLQTVRRTIAALMQCLPQDPGRQRAFDDERRIMFLADIFEQAGGKPTAYVAHSKTGRMADTPFRKFAQLFYCLLPAEDKQFWRS